VTGHEAVAGVTCSHEQERLRPRAVDDDEARRVDGADGRPAGREGDGGHGGGFLRQEA
jgi:hypothetical protein